MVARAEEGGAVAGGVAVGGADLVVVAVAAGGSSRPMHVCGAALLWPLRAAQLPVKSESPATGTRAHENNFGCSVSRLASTRSSAVHAARQTSLLHSDGLFFLAPHRRAERE